MRIRNLTLFCLAAVLALNALAQPRDRMRRREQNNAAFLEAAPRIGDVLPELSGYDAEGKPFSLKQLRGRTAVVIFGCLT